MSKAAAVTTATFEDEVLNSSTPVLVDFWAEWCGPCKMIGPHVDALAEEYAGKVKVVKVDVDEERELAERFGILSIPTLLLFKNGDVIDQIQGAMPKQAIAAHLEQAL